MSLSVGNTIISDPANLVGGNQLSEISVGDTIIWKKSIISGDTFEFIIDQTTDDLSAMISYAGANAEFTAAHMDYNADSFDYGSWKDTWLMKAFKPCMVHANGSVEYYLNPDNLSQKADGSDAMSDLTTTDHDMNAMVEVAQIWIKEEEIDEDHFHIYLSPTKQDGFDCWTHYGLDNTLGDKYYFAMYKGSLDSNKKMRSLSGQWPDRLTEGNLQKQYCQANGVGWDCREWSFQRLMQYVLMLVGKSTNVQTVFGQGWSDVINSTTLSTGGKEDKGMFWGENNGAGHVVVFGMEDFWGNVHDLTNGLQCGTSGDNAGFFVKMTPGTADGSTGTEYTDTLTDYIAIPWADLGRSSNLDGYVTKMKLIPGRGLFAKECHEFDRKGYCDYWYDTTSHYWAHVGGPWYYELACGPFCVQCDNELYSRGLILGASLSLSKTNS